MRATTVTMSETEANKRRIDAFIEEVWRQGRLDALAKYWTADCVNHADPAPEKTGLAALRRYHEAFAGAFADFEAVEIELQRQIAEGDQVATQILTRARHRPSGRPVSLATIRIDRLVDGRIAEHWSVADMAGLMGQLA